MLKSAKMDENMFPEKKMRVIFGFIFGNGEDDQKRTPYIVGSMTITYFEFLMSFFTSQNTTIQAHWID